MFLTFSHFRKRHCNIQKELSIVVLIKVVLKIYSKFTGEHLCRSEISIQLLCNFIELTLRHGCSCINLRHIFRTPFHNKSFGGLLLILFSTFPRFPRLLQHIFYQQGTSQEKRSFSRKKKFLHESFEVLKENKRKKGKEMIVFKNCCLLDSG